MRTMFFLLLLTLCSSAAAALRCTTCDNATCNNPGVAPCGGGELMCLSAFLTLNFTANGTSVQRRVQQCTTLQVCSQFGTHDYEADLGYVTLQARARCCNRDSCNQTPQPSPATQGPANSLQCFACNSSTSSTCNQTLTCQGAEDRCLGASVTASNVNHSAFGCVSSNLCQVLPFLTSFAGLGDIVRISGCCDSGLCNNGIPTTPAPPVTNATTVTPGPTGNTTESGNHAPYVGVSALHLLLPLALLAAF